MAYSNSCNFTLNEKKTVLQQNKGKRIITGISIADKKIAVPSNYKRKLRQEVHYIKTFGIVSHISKLKIKDPIYLFSIMGKLRFWLAVEPNNKFALDSLAFLTKSLPKNP